MRSERPSALSLLQRFVNPRLISVTEISFHQPAIDLRSKRVEYVKSSLLGTRYTYMYIYFLLELSRILALYFTKRNPIVVLILDR